MTSERANHLTGGHRWNEANERCVVSRREFDETGELCWREYRSGFTFDLPRNEQIEPLSEADREKSVWEVPGT
jgi:hypothetical protein